MVQTNRDRLVAQSVIGEITSPRMAVAAFRVGQEGKARIAPGTGGIVYTHRIGDSAIDLVGDHVEPGVSVANREGDGSPTTPANVALNTLACIGNRARVVSGDAKGESGYVTGTHGGINHVLIDFPGVVLDQLTIGDKIQIRAFGTGLELVGIGGVAVMNLDPELFERLDVRLDGDAIEVPVTHVIPAKLMGSGYGHAHAASGDIDIQLFDPHEYEEHRLASLRFGDLVAISDMAAEHGRIWYRGAVTIGVVVHSRSDVAGHGPGVTMIMSSRNGRIQPRIDSEANLKQLLYDTR
jgi:hypothetical protein